MGWRHAPCLTARVFGLGYAGESGSNIVKWHLHACGLAKNGVSLFHPSTLSGSAQHTLNSWTRTSFPPHSRTSLAIWATRFTVSTSPVFGSTPFREPALIRFASRARQFFAPGLSRPGFFLLFPSHLLHPGLPEPFFWGETSSVFPSVFRAHVPFRAVHSRRAQLRFPAQVRPSGGSEVGPMLLGLDGRWLRRGPTKWFPNFVGVQKGWSSWFSGTFWGGGGGLEHLTPW